MLEGMVVSTLLAQISLSGYVHKEAPFCLTHQENKFALSASARLHHHNHRWST